MKKYLTLQENLEQEQTNRSQMGKLVQNLEDRMTKIKTFYQCQICFEVDVDCLLAPCGHGLCKNCLEKNKQNGRKCPFCRKTIMSTTPLYKPSEI